MEECVERFLGRHVDNPRAGALMEHAQRTLRGQVEGAGERSAVRREIAEH